MTTLPTLAARSKLTQPSRLTVHFKVHGVRLAESKQGLNIFMPQKAFNKNGKTQYADVFHPITAGARNALKEAVIDAYKKALK